jgi:hypothetical protein
MEKPLFTTCIGVAVLCLGCLITNATVTFNSFPVVDNDIQSGTHAIEGYNFTSAHWHVINDFFPGISQPTDGQYLGLDGPTLAFPITMSQVGGGSFSLLDFMGNELWNSVPPGFPNATSIELTGNVHGGGTVTTSLALDGDPTVWQHFVVNWNNLDSVVFSGNLDYSIAIDSINVVSVPEPSTLLISALGLVGAGVTGLVRRNRRS